MLVVAKELEPSLEFGRDSMAGREVGQPYGEQREVSGGGLHTWEGGAGGGKGSCLRRRNWESWRQAKQKQDVLCDW